MSDVALLAWSNCSGVDREGLGFQPLGGTAIGLPVALDLGKLGSKPCNFIVAVLNNPEGLDAGGAILASTTNRRVAATTALSNATHPPVSKAAQLGGPFSDARVQYINITLVLLSDPSLMKLTALSYVSMGGNEAAGYTVIEAKPANDSLSTWLVLCGLPSWLQVGSKLMPPSG
jgi:hypothetical protein